VSLIEEILPAYHFRDVHERAIDASPAAVSATPSARLPGPSRPGSAA
jgi:hypothetical protein